VKSGIAGTASRTPERFIKAAGKAARPSLSNEVQSALEWLKERATKATLDGMARYGIPSDHALGVALKDIKALGKQLGRNQELVGALWETGVYEARMLASFVGDPARITPAQMDRWCRQFDNWAFCDTMCFSLFDHTPHAWAVKQWAGRKKEFEAHGFRPVVSPSLHDRPPREKFRGLKLIERDNRRPQFVKKAVNMAPGEGRRTLKAAVVSRGDWPGLTMRPRDGSAGSRSRIELTRFGCRQTPGCIRTALARGADIKARRCLRTQNTHTRARVAPPRPHGPAPRLS
jgi:3-methyladenine DNA glycosylase AlkD